MLAPKGFTQHLTQESFEIAQAAAAKKRGVLRFTLPVIMGVCALAVLGVWTVLRNPYSVGFWLTGALFAAAAAMLLILWLAVFPAREKKYAAARYALYDVLYGETVVTLSSDEMILAGEKLTRCIEYAKTRLCVETTQHFLIFTDDDAVVMLEKSAFTDTAATVDFLRTVFARWYVRKGRAV